MYNRHAIVKKQAVAIVNNVSLRKHNLYMPLVCIVVLLVCKFCLVCVHHIISQPHHNAFEHVTLNLKSIA